MVRVVTGLGARSGVGLAGSALGLTEADFNPQHSSLIWTITVRSNQQIMVST